MPSRMGLAATVAGCTKGALASHVHWQKLQSAFRTGRHNPTFIVLLLSTSRTGITKDVHVVWIFSLYVYYKRGPCRAQRTAGGSQSRRMPQTHPGSWPSLCTGSPCRVSRMIRDMTIAATISLRTRLPRPYSSSKTVLGSSHGSLLRDVAPAPRYRCHRPRTKLMNSSQQ